ncbi:MAG TPA: M23 family metallopeptidase [Devosiaceae bacterium]
MSARPQVSHFGKAPKARAARVGAGGISPRLFYTVFTGLVATNILTLVGFLMAPDIAGLLSGPGDQVLSAYQDRVADLRVEVDRLQSRQYAQNGDINLQLQEISQQQDVLSEQQQYVKALADKAAQLGLQTAFVPPDSDSKPPLVTGAAAGKQSPRDQANAAGAAVKQMLDESRTAMTSISESATKSTDEIVAQLDNLGITLALPEDGDEGEGGPLLPPIPDGPDASGTVDDANAVMAALIRYQAARGAIDQAPIHHPLDGKMRMTSGFGNRKDPFTGRQAFHPGLDFGEPNGTSVLSAGSGTVSFVGQRTGYGNTVEIDHGHGIVSRYGHLSAFLVKEGQVVATGTPIAKVGSTGRSTGPHLHFEIRRNDQSVNPLDFLQAGQALEKFQGA